MSAWLTQSRMEGLLIYLFHIIMGSFLVYVGYELLIKNKLNDKLILLIIILGALAVAYHAHLLFLSFIQGKGNKAKNKK
jgi:hypothetical protein